MGRSTLRCVRSEMESTIALLSWADVKAHLPTRTQQTDHSEDDEFAIPIEGPVVPDAPEVWIDVDRTGWPSQKGPRGEVSVFCITLGFHTEPPK